MKILFISTYSAYGDQIAINGMVNFLSLYYDKIIMLVHWNFLSVIEHLYSSNDKVFSMSYDYFMFNDIFGESYDELDCMCLLGSDYIDNTCKGKEPNSVYDDSTVTVPDFHSKNIFTEVYSQKNPIGHKFGFNVQRLNDLDMVSEFYNKMGFPDEMKYKCFDFSRLENDENTLIEDLNLPDSYAVVCEYDKPPGLGDTVLNHISNISDYNQSNIISRKYIISNNIINIHMLSKKYFDIVKLIENAQEVHLIENSFSMFIYFLQITNRMKKVPINFHCYCRKENWRKSNYKVYMKPKLDNWNFIFE